MDHGPGKPTISSTAFIRHRRTKASVLEGCNSLQRRLTTPSSSGDHPPLLPILYENACLLPQGILQSNGQIWHSVLTWKDQPPRTSVEFMDLTISIEQSRLVTKIFKEKRRTEPLPLSSSLHRTYDWNHQSQALSSGWFFATDFNTRVELFFHRLVNRGYRPKVLTT